MRTAITGGMVALPTGAVAATVVIEGGRIAEIVDGGRASADETIDARGLLVLPGGIDCHVHYADPGNPEREDFGSGTAQSALGGVTTVFEHPLTVPMTVTADAYAAKRADVGTRAHVDFGLWGGIVPGYVDEIDGMWAAGARGFKAFMCDSGGPYPASDDVTLLDGMRAVARLGGLVLVHAENDTLVRGLAARERDAGDAAAHLRSRPPFVEDEATARALILAREAGARLQVVHVSSADSARLVDAACEAGVAATLEHCTHHLTLTEADFVEVGTRARCAPPLRSATQVEAIWKRLERGAPAALVSDHSPYTHAEKDVDDMFAAGMGIQSAQEYLPVGVHAALERGLPLHRIANLIAGAAARAIGLPAKGTIAPGRDADLVLLDPDSPWIVDSASQQRARNPWSPYDGRRCDVRVARTILRGRTISQDGELTAAPGSGGFVTPDHSKSGLCVRFPTLRTV
jgi:allantoinase